MELLVEHERNECEHVVLGIADEVFLPVRRVYVAVK